jgi:rhamnulokinase
MPVAFAPVEEDNTMATSDFLALDLGAESGRAVLGKFDGARLELSEVHRFANGPVRLGDGLHWDVLHLWSEIKQGIALALRDGARDLASVGVDTWGVDFGLLDRTGALIGNPYHYRDSRTDGMIEEAFRRVPRAEIFEATGIQFMPINTLFQLLSMVIGHSPALDIAETFLTIPDLLNYWLTGQAVCEFSNATTTQCYDPRQADWAHGLLQRLGIPTAMMPSIVPPSTDLGPLLPAVAAEVGLPVSAATRVVAPACHDTGSAVAAVPAACPGFAWISSGTWSIVGAEVASPVINEQSLHYNLTNEGGVNGTFRLSRNVMGLWLVQECRRTWARQGQELGYDALTAMAARARPFRAVIDPDYGEFLSPGDMPGRIQAFCRRTGQEVPSSKEAILRCALESIALKYRWVLDRLEEMLGRRLEPLHIVGGGVKNELLSQFTADATGRHVIAGPVEATAIGNVLVQMMAVGHVASLHEARSVVAQSFELAHYEPGPRDQWDAAYERLLALLPTYA